MTTNTDSTTGMLGIDGLRFTLDDRPFPFTGISFFNAIYNPAFNASGADMREWMRRFGRYGINVLRIWAQWDSVRGFVDTSPDSTLYEPDGTLRAGPLERLKRLVATARDEGVVVELALFSQESWFDGIRIEGEAADRAVAAVTRELMPYRNVVLQVWNEFSDRVGDHVDTIRAVDPRRIVTNSPGYAGVLMSPPYSGVVDQKLDFLTPHTSRQRDGTGPHWTVAPLEIGLLIERFRRPVVDDEPARNGTSKFGGPNGATNPYDHILQIHAVWQNRGHIVYHHDMFQTGAASEAVPPSGIPEPEFSPYHRQVLEFVALRDRYFDLYAAR